MLPGPNDLPGEGQIPPPGGVNEETIPMPSVQNNAATAPPGDAFAIRGQGNGQPAAAPIVGTPVTTPVAAGQGQNPLMVPPSTGAAQVTGATPPHQINSPMAINNNAQDAGAGQPTALYNPSGIRRAIGAL